MPVDPATRDLIVRFRDAHSKMKAAAEELQRAAEKRAADDIQMMLAAEKQRAQDEVMALVKELDKTRAG